MNFQTEIEILIRARYPILYIITSEEMLVYPDAETARTSTPVTIVQGASVIKGTALEADNRLRLYKLQGRASASIHRQKGSPP